MEIGPVVLPPASAVTFSLRAVRALPAKLAEEPGYGGPVGARAHLLSTESRSSGYSAASCYSARPVAEVPRRLSRAPRSTPSLRRGWRTLAPPAAAWTSQAASRRETIIL